MVDSIKCGQCGKYLDVEFNLDSKNQKPCPNCSSTVRNISVSVYDTIKVSSDLTVRFNILATTNLLLQTVIIPGEKTLEGRIVEAVSIPWFEIISFLKKDPDIAFKIPYDKWEEIVAGAYKKAGFDEVTLTPRSGDLGRDVIAIKKGIGSIRVIDQVKAYKPGHLVTANDVRALLGVLQGDGASKGFLTTTSDFAPKIKEDPLITPFIPSRIELINGPKLMQRLEELSISKDSINHVR